MNNQLMPYVTGQMEPAKQDRAVTRAGKQVYDEVRLAAIKADGAMALAAHLTEGAANLMRHAASVAGDDPAVQMAVGPIVGTALKQALNIQANLYNPWEF